ncbi:MAG: hypothetical protein CVU05_12470 [Bacteroidetes bacterium HGW-Bacteroidetes-21]|nr:MAG: hypothetical protein CVU05_12470 [Bacteroidetes bacterium HGW-Bacteroidetes-21]
MKNGYDKIDDVFRKPLENLESTPPDEIFEKAFDISGVAKKTGYSGPWFSSAIILISGIILLTAAYIFLPTENNNQAANKLQNFSKNNNTALTENLSSNKTEILQSKENTNQIITPSPTIEKENNSSNILSSTVPVKTKTNNVTTNIPSGKTHNLTNTNPLIAITSVPVQDEIKTNKNPVDVTQNQTTDINSNNETPSTQVTPEERFTFNTSKSTKQNDENILSETVLSNETDPYIIHKLHSLKYSGISTVTINPELANFVNPDTTKIRFTHWAVDVSASAHILNTKIKALNPEKQSFTDSREEALKPGLSFFNTSAMITYQHKNLNLSGGISYSQFEEMTDYGMVLTNPVNSFALSYNGTPYTFNSGDNYYLVDTTQYWHYTYMSDSMIHVIDSVQKLDFDTSLVSIYDTLPITLFDTVDFSKLRAQYSLVEFPFWAGIEINKGNWGYSVNAGIIPGILFRRKGSFYNGTSEVMLPSETFPTQKFVLSGGLKLLFHYYPQSQLMLFVGPEIRTSFISSTPKNSGISQKWTSWGINGGIRYFFN